MTKVLCIVDGAPVMISRDPLEISAGLLSGLFPSAKTIKASWYTGTAVKNEIYYESNK